MAQAVDTQYTSAVLARLAAGRITPQEAEELLALAPPPAEPPATQPRFAPQPPQWAAAAEPVEPAPVRRQSGDVWRSAKTGCLCVRADRQTVALYADAWRALLDALPRVEQELARGGVPARKPRR